MSPEQKAAFINAQAACLNGRIFAMYAENLYRLSSGLDPLYREQDFLRIIDESPCNHNAVLTLFTE